MKNKMIFAAILFIIIIIIPVFLLLTGNITYWQILPFFISFILPLILFVGGIYSLIKYKETKRRIFLIIGLVLTFVIIGYFILLIPSFFRAEQTMTYI